MAYVCYDELHLDNALSHRGNLFLTTLERSVNAVPVFGPKEAPNTRPNIEMLFGLLEEAGIHPLDSTTGSSPKDPRRNRNTPYVLDIEVLQDLIDILVCRYNAGIAPGTTISRLEILRRSVQRETAIVRRVPKAEREHLLEFDIFDEAAIGIEHDRVIVRWADARYTSDTLKQRIGLKGQRVLVMAKTHDLRFIQVSLMESGEKLGELAVEKRWRLTPHGMATRRQAKRTMSNSSFVKTAADIPRAMREHAEKDVAIKASQKRLLARTVIEQRNRERSEEEISSDEKIYTGDGAVFEQDDEVWQQLLKIGTSYR